MVRIRSGTIADLPAITEIYNDAIIHLTATFDTDPKTLEQQIRWFEDHTVQFPIMVAEMKGGEISGWASLSRWSDRCAYSATAEASLYIKSQARGKGIGSATHSNLSQPPDTISTALTPAFSSIWQKGIASCNENPPSKCSSALSLNMIGYPGPVSLIAH